MLPGEEQPDVDNTILSRLKHCRTEEDLVYFKQHLTLSLGEAIRQLQPLQNQFLSPSRKKKGLRLKKCIGRDLKHPIKLRSIVDELCTKSLNTRYIVMNALGEDIFTSAKNAWPLFLTEPWLDSISSKTRSKVINREILSILNSLVWSVYFQRKALNITSTLEPGRNVNDKISELLQLCLEKSKILLDHTLVTIFGLALMNVIDSSTALKTTITTFHLHRDQWEEEIDREIEKWEFGKVSEEYHLHKIKSQEKILVKCAQQVYELLSATVRRDKAPEKLDGASSVINSNLEQEAASARLVEESVPSPAINLKVPTTPSAFDVQSRASASLSTSDRISTSIDPIEEDFGPATIPPADTIDATNVDKTRETKKKKKKKKKKGTRSSSFHQHSEPEKGTPSSSSTKDTKPDTSVPPARSHSSSGSTFDFTTEVSPPLTSHTNLASKGFRSPSIPTTSSVPSPPSVNSIEPVERVLKIFQQIQTTTQDGYQGFRNQVFTYSQPHPARSPIERVIKLLEEMQAVIQVGYATFRRTGNSGPVKDADDLDNVLAAVHVLFKGCTNIAKLQEHLIFCAPPSCRLGSFNRSQLDLIWKLLGGDENDTQLAPSISESLRILRYNDAPDAPVQMQSLVLDLIVLFHTHMARSFCDWFSTTENKDYPTLRINTARHEKLLNKSLKDFDVAQMTGEPENDPLDELKKIVDSINSVYNQFSINQIVPRLQKIHSSIEQVHQKYLVDCKQTQGTASTASDFKLINIAIAIVHKCFGDVLAAFPDPDRDAVINSPPPVSDAKVQDKLWELMISVNGKRSIQYLVKRSLDGLVSEDAASDRKNQWKLDLVFLSTTFHIAIATNLLRRKGEMYNTAGTPETLTRLDHAMAVFKSAHEQEAHRKAYKNLVTQTNAVYALDFSTWKTTTSQSLAKYEPERRSGGR